MNCPTCGCPGATMLLLTTPCPNPECAHYDAGGRDDVALTINGTPMREVHEWLEAQKPPPLEPDLRATMHGCAAQPGWTFAMLSGTVCPYCQWRSP